MRDLVKQWAKKYLINEGNFSYSIENPDDYKQDNQFRDADEYEEWMKERENLMMELKPSGNKTSKKKIKEEEETQKSDVYIHAKKLGFFGHEKDAPVWLASEYGQWRQHVLDILTRHADGDETKAEEWFELYDRLSTCMYGTSFGQKGGGYKDSKELRDELAAELGDDPEVRELMKKIDDKWEADIKSLTEFYATSSQRNGWTGD